MADIKTTITRQSCILLYFFVINDGCATFFDNLYFKQLVKDSPNKAQQNYIGVYMDSILCPNQCTRKEKCPSQAEAWKMAYDMIKLENDLINHRMTSMIVANGFLVAGVFQSITKITYNSTHKENIPIFIFIILLSFVGLCISCAVARGIRAASRQIICCDNWYQSYCANKHRNNEICNHSSPPIVGVSSALYVFGIKVCYRDLQYNNIEHDNDTNIERLGSGISYLPSALIVVWFTVGFITFLSLVITVIQISCESAQKLPLPIVLPH